MGSTSNCPRFKVKKFIFASTGGAIYGDAKVIPTPESYLEFPLSPYDIEKLAIDKYLNYYHKVFGLPYVSLRLANVYGPRQNSKGEAGVIAIFCDKRLNGKQPVINGSGSQTRDFIFVEDVVEAAFLAMKIKKSGIYNIGAAKETDINTIFKKLKKLIGSKCKKIHGPFLPGEQKRSCLDYSKAKRELGWQPKYALDKCLNKTV
jgi:UDP-glucose 4-epimerase